MRQKHTTGRGSVFQQNSERLGLVSSARSLDLVKADLKVEGFYEFEVWRERAVFKSGNNNPRAGERSRERPRERSSERPGER